MGMPSINITFQTLGVTTIKRSQKGVVALIIKDAANSGEVVMNSAAEVPAALSEENRAYILRAFTGYVNPPRKVIAFVIDGTEKTLEDALRFFALKKFDYICGPFDMETADTQKMSEWVKAERAKKHFVKAVLPNAEADCEGIVNFTTTGIKAGGKTFTSAAYCSRIAGLIAGTPMTISCTYAPLPEVEDIDRLTLAEMDAAVDGGAFILFHDGEKVKAGRAVNSLTTIAVGKGAELKKIKIVEALDMLESDISMTVQDNYIGKYANSYDNKQLLAVAIKGYLEETERAGIIQAGSSSVMIDVEAQKNYLKSQGISTDEMSEDEIKHAVTGSSVFLAATAKPLDAIEDVKLIIEL